MMLGIVLELYWDIFKAVVYLELGLKHDGFEISGSLISPIILKRILVILVRGVCRVTISDGFLIGQIEFVVVVSHV